MIPRSQHFGDRAPFPFDRSGIMRIFEQPRFEALVHPRWKPRPLRREAAECKRRAAPARPSRRPTGYSRRSRPARSPRASNIRSSNPSNRPHRMVDAGARRELADARLGQRLARAASSPAPGGRRRRCRSPRRARRRAAPSPPRRPPACRRRCGACRSRSRGCCTASSDHCPSPSARPASDMPSGPGNISGIERQDGGGEGHGAPFSRCAGRGIGTMRIARH